MPLSSSPAGGRIAIIIDDMGYSYRHGKAMLDLPGEITYAFLPHAPFTQRLSQLARQRGKEIMVHLPMQDLSGNSLDEGGLKLDMTRQSFFRTLLDSLDAVPYAVGANNHMGSLLTRHPGSMHWLMLGLKSYGDLFFIDSLTSEDSVALSVAAESGVASRSRDVFLDHQRDTASISRQFDQLIARGRRSGRAIGIGHPYPETLQVLRQKLANLPQSAVSLVKTSTLVGKSSEQQQIWHASSSPSPKAAKNSKPSP
ncbi:MAG: divergent polysaccharide deacetylase family protein [Gammaproteobacteria bacterium]|nr:divergent polysaccharide deacetylase family protein [Gammaproteobacteria bacterium]